MISIPVCVKSGPEPGASRKGAGALQVLAAGLLRDDGQLWTDQGAEQLCTW